MLLIDCLRTCLIEEGLVRDPKIAGPLPPCWRSPKNGVPAPGEGSVPEIGPTVVVALYTAPSIPRSSYDASVLRTDGLDIRIRATTAPAAIELDDQIRAVLVDQRAWMMGGLEIVESRLERPLDLIYSDDQGFDFTAGYLFERRT